MSTIEIHVTAESLRHVPEGQGLSLGKVPAGATFTSMRKTDTGVALSFELPDEALQASRAATDMAGRLIESQERLLRQALEALEHHRAQTRPIERTDAVIAALRAALDL